MTNIELDGLRHGGVGYLGAYPNARARSGDWVDLINDAFRRCSIGGFCRLYIDARAHFTGINRNSFHRFAELAQVHNIRGARVCVLVGPEARADMTELFSAIARYQGLPTEVYITNDPTTGRNWLVSDDPGLQPD